MCKHAGVIGDRSTLFGWVSLVLEPRFHTILFGVTRFHDLETPFLLRVTIFRFVFTTIHSWLLSGSLLTSIRSCCLVGLSAAISKRVCFMCV